MAERLPIKLIMPKQGKERRVRGGGNKAEPFRDVTPAYRKSLSRQVLKIRESIENKIGFTGGAPVRVSLISKASAKSHRPEQLFSDRTCPIVGAGKLGELFLRATPSGLDRLNQLILTNDSAQVTKELSCVESIETITADFRRRGIAAEDLLRRSPRGESGFIVRVRLFDFGPERGQERLVDDFESQCKKLDIGVNHRGYSARSHTYAVECRNTSDVDAISNIVGVRSIQGMPTLQIVRPRSVKAGDLPRLSIPHEEAGEDIPVVVVVDSGISTELPELNQWVQGRESYVAPPYQNTDHGTFVAGLICWGAELNPTLSGINSDPCGLFDLQILPNNDPEKGATESIVESEFLVSLETSLRQWANKYKVWNLSLGTDATCSLDEFSPLAEELDNLQEKYQVTFVISAGNYVTPPLLDYPRTGKELPNGRITSPADSVLGVTVGAISHVDYQKDGPSRDHPSAYSRHGSGPNYIIKPDVVHYGGACAIDASHMTGIRSIKGRALAEDLGTSFATPLVSRTLAQIYHQITPTPSPVLARALLTHHARDPRNGGRVPDGEENFFGFGRPAPVPYCLECTPHSSTLVFDDVLRPGYFLEWDDFPYPPSLRRDGKYFGEIWMTVAFSPSRGARWGTEYCETHIDAHFGIYRERVNRKTGEVSTVFRGLVPPEHKNPGVLYESYQVAQLRKWAPVRTYHGQLGENGISGLRWRLKLQLLTRHGIDDEDTFKPQPFSVIITIADPTGNAPVYDEMSRLVLNRYQSQNVAVRAAARVQTQSRNP